MSITEDRVVNGRKGRARFTAADRIAAFARATEGYAQGLDDPDLANVYWGKSLGLRQAVAILMADCEAPPRGRCIGRTSVADPGTSREEPWP